MKNPFLFKACIYEKNEGYAEFLKYIFELNTGYQVILANSINSFESLIEKIKPDIITTDLSNEIDQNSKLFEIIKNKSPESNIIIISNENNSSIIFQAVKSGVMAYIEKNEDTKIKLIHLLNQINFKKTFNRKNNSLNGNYNKVNDYSSLIVGKSIAIRKIDELIDKAAQSSINVLITGETGTGKELVAKCIHQNSLRRKFPLVTVNMAAIPNDLLESELLGHEKGAFTGASALRVGKFELAGEGTIFLDEIGEMDYNLQAKILRVLQEKEIVRVGGSKTIKVNCRIITATNKNLPEEVSLGKFREDLYYRLYGLNIHLPALRERGSDKILIAEYLINNFCKENQMNLVKLSEDAKKKILNYSFPGNIRELKSLIELAVVMSNGIEICYNDLRIENQLNFKKLIKEEKTLEEYQKEIVKYYLDRYNKNVVKVASKLAVGKSTIYRMIKENHEYFDLKN